MKNSTTLSDFWFITSMIATTVLLRIITNQLSLFNFAPMIAIALFAGAKYNNTKAAFIIPIVVMFLTDVVLAYLNNFDVLHNSILFTYGSIFLIILLGRILKNDTNYNTVKTTAFSLLASAIFFIITNFGTWLFSNMYSLDLQGLIQCYVAAIPFNKFSWLSDLFYVTALFSIYNWITVRNTTPAKETISIKK